jgi:hypothetical protein
LDRQPWLQIAPHPNHDLLSSATQSGYFGDRDRELRDVDRVLRSGVR